MTPCPARARRGHRAPINACRQPRRRQSVHDSVDGTNGTCTEPRRRGDDQLGCERQPTLTLWARRPRSTRLAPQLPGTRLRRFGHADCSVARLQLGYGRHSCHHVTAVCAGPLTRGRRAYVKRTVLSIGGISSATRRQSSTTQRQSRTRPERPPVAARRSRGRERLLALTCPQPSRSTPRWPRSVPGQPELTALTPDCSLDRRNGLTDSARCRYGDSVRTGREPGARPQT